MSRKPETSFTQGVHKHLPPSLHREKMHNPYSSGTADVWYSGAKADLWIEYKFIPKIPVRDHTPVVPDCSALQIKWLHDRYQEGRNVAVIVGSPSGGIVLRDLQWERGCSASEFRKVMLTRKQLADWIQLQTMTKT